MSSSVRFAEFGPFKLFPAERRLVRQEQQVALGSRALDILIMLVDRAGSVVTKQELIAGVWPDTTVEEGSLRVHIAALRKALADGQNGHAYVANSTGRGYSFVGPVTWQGGEATAEPPLAPSRRRSTGLPRRPAQILGRDADMAAISALLTERRFVTVHGPGGIGKTTVALAVTHDQAGSFRDGVRFLDLGLRHAHDNVADVVASALGLMVQSNDPTASIVDALHDRQMLLVFDCCEHVIHSAAALAETIVQESPQISILATSRELLRAEGEHIYALGPLQTPPQGLPISARQLLDYPSTRLFLERVVAGGHRAELSDAEAQTVADICRRVDGIALALELAAGRIGTHGLQGTANLLDSRLKLLWQGRRTALPRHQTLHATLDWSHGLIAEHERAVLRRLSIFVGPFALEAAQAVAADAGIGPPEVAEGLAQLVSKSLVVVDMSEETTRYRLLDTTRAYTHAKLAEAGELGDAARKHALYYAELLNHFQVRNQKIGEFGAEHVANVQAGLEWCFSATGDAELAIRLANASTRLFREFSLLGECRQWCERALAILPEPMRGTYWELNLHASLGYCMMFTEGNGEQICASFEEGLKIAQALGDHYYHFRLLSGLHMYYRRKSELGRLLGLAKQAEALAPALRDPTATVAANVMLGISHHLMGDLAAARAALAASLDQQPSPYSFRTNYLGFHQDGKIVLAGTLWLQGFPDQALALTREVETEDPADPVTACLTLIWAMNVLLWTGEWAKAESCVERIVQIASENSLLPYRMAGIGFKGDLLVKRGDVPAGLRLLREALGSLGRGERYGLFAPWLSGAVAQGHAALGQLDLALAHSSAVAAAIGRDGGVYNAPELLRVHGEILRQTGEEPAAERVFRQAIDLAARQTAQSWKLRAATSLARLLAGQSRNAEARTILADAHSRFSEGFETADLQAATSLLRDLDHALAG